MFSSFPRKRENGTTIGVLNFNRCREPQIPSRLLYATYTTWRAGPFLCIRNYRPLNGSKTKCLASKYLPNPFECNESPRSRYIFAEAHLPASRATWYISTTTLYAKTQHLSSIPLYHLTNHHSAAELVLSPALTLSWCLVVQSLYIFMTPLRRTPRARFVPWLLLLSFVRQSSRRSLNHLKLICVASQAQQKGKKEKC